MTNNLNTETFIKHLLSELGKVLVFINTPDSGRLAETTLQLLPEGTFNDIELLVTNGTSQVVNNFLDHFCGRIVQKLYLKVTVEEYQNAMQSLYVLINAEHSRREGMLEYSWLDDIFNDDPKDKGYTKLTEKGREFYNANVLKEFSTQYIT